MADKKTIDVYEKDNAKTEPLGFNNDTPVQRAEKRLERKGIQIVRIIENKHE